MNKRNIPQPERPLAYFHMLHSQAAESPWLAALLLKRAAMLKARVAYFYQQLTSLPRRWRRRLQKLLTAGLVGAALLLAFGPTPSVHAATITVTPLAAGINIGDGCSLVEAIINANDTTTGQPYIDCDMGDPSGADTIVLAGNTYTYTIAYGTFNALPDITSEVTIEGNGSTIERDSGAATNFRVMAVNSSGNLTLNQVTLTGGNGAASGGGLLVDIGDATINDSTISGNSANNTGGGVSILRRGTLTINNSTISGNSALVGGGGITAQKLGDNNATGITVTVNNSTISGNSANRGGGIRAYARSYYNSTVVAVTVNNSTISGNTAGLEGGGIQNQARDYSGDPTQATITLNNSTVTGNSAANGGGIFNRRYVNATANIFLHRSIVSGNSATTSGDELYATGGSNTYLADYNLLGDSSHTNAQAFSGVTAGASDITSTSNGTNPTHLSDILDTTLANNGGPTLTHALVPVSPAVDEAPAADCAAAPIGGLDQNGAPRAGGPGNGGIACDIGAVEYATPTYPTTIVPTPGAAGLNGYDGCSLVEAIITANTDVPTGGCLDVGGADTIVLAGNTYTYTAAYGTSSALPDITSEITIEGNDSTIERDGGAPTFRLLLVTSGGDLTLNQATVTGGNQFNGGGLIVFNGTVTLNEVDFTDNQATQLGGGLRSEGSSSVVEINNSSFSFNSATVGGAIAHREGTLTINNSVLHDNSASFAGGGVLNERNGNVTITDSTIRDNEATGTADGGGVANHYGTMTINNSTISGNSASQGGGINNYASNFGAFSSTTSVLTLNNSTVSNNSATTYGGGIANAANASIGAFEDHEATATINNSTVTGNTAPNGGGVYNGEASGPGTATTNLYLHRSLISGNSATTAANELFSNVINGNAAGDDNNLFADSAQTNAQAFSGFTPGASDISATSDGTNPTPLANILNTTLANNGGPTLTHALVSGSPAVDASPTGPSTDQRGVTRPLDGDGDSTANYDIGAYELGTIICGLTANNPINIANLSLTITNLGSDLNCVRAANIPHNHPNATPGIRTGQFWEIDGLQSDQLTPATVDFTFNITLPHNVTPNTNANVCQYPASGNWNCGRTGSNTTTVWRDGNTAGFSDWAVGDNVTPTAITLRSLAASAADAANGIGLLAAVLAGLSAVTFGVWRRLRKYS